ncbi:MAG: cation-translocating P-type ATPase [Ktedonobacteraceae bacterium]
MAASEKTEVQLAYHVPTDQVLMALTSDTKQGLSTAQAQERLQQYGKNVLPTAPPVPAWLRFLAQFTDPLTILLLVATAISFFAWLIERDAPLPYEALTILAIVLLNGVLGYVQENRAEQAVAALQNMAAPTTNVLREGQHQAIPTTDVVPGDILLIEEGDTIPADARVVESIELRVAEAALTGESLPVLKESTTIPAEVGLGDRLNMLFSGTAVASGRGRAVVVSTGAQTEIGKIAGSLEQAKDEKTPLQRELDQVGRLLGIVVITIAIVVSATILFISQVRTVTEIVDILLLAVSLAVAAVPEGLTAITTIILSLGMQRMARRHVIMRKLAAVETLGSTTAICTDKTGTLTRNEMTVRAIVTASGHVDFTGTGYSPEGTVQQDGQPLTQDSVRHEVTKTLLGSVLANNAALLQREGSWVIRGDPTEGALLVAARKVGLKEEELATHFSRIAELPFTSERKLMSTLHQKQDSDQNTGAVVFAKGAPDVLLARCTHELVDTEIRPLTAQRRTSILSTVEDLAAEALRTIGVASRVLPVEGTVSKTSEQVERDFVWLGVVGMIDPPRPEAKRAVQQAQQAGVRVIMITGDHPITAVKIAQELGIVNKGEQAVTGVELQNFDDEQLRTTARSCSVYARVAPQHKLRIVQALKANGEITAMTGDGVNDAPALKMADIGVAMGITGTDVAKGVADMILTDDNFASIVAAVEEGRSIFANIQKFLCYLLSSNIGEILTMFFGVVLAGVIGLQPETGTLVILPLLSTQILWVNLLTDSGPALALGIDPSDAGQMQRPPRNPRNRVITRWMWFDIFFIGVAMALGTLLVMDWSLPGGLIAGTGTMPYARTMAFTTLVFAQLFNVLHMHANERSVFRTLFTNPWIWLAVLTSIVLQVLVIYIPLLQVAFGTVALQASDWLVTIFVASSVLWLRELFLPIRRRFGSLN